MEYLHGDLTGNIRTVTDTDGTVIGASDYSAYGVETAAGDVAVSQVTAFGYAGEYTDDTGLIYLRARFYDPTTAQFLSIDALIDLTQMPYGYTDGNPLQLVDPLGLWGWKVWEWTADNWATVGTIAGVVGTTAAVAGMWLTPIGPIATGLVVAANVVGGVASAGEITRSCFLGDTSSSCGSAVGGAAISVATMGLGAGLSKAGVGLGGTLSAGKVEAIVDGLSHYFGRRVDQLSSILAKETMSGIELLGLYASECLV